MQIGGGSARRRRRGRWHRGVAPLFPADLHVGVGMEDLRQLHPPVALLGERSGEMSLGPPRDMGGPVPRFCHSRSGRCSERPGRLEGRDPGARLVFLAHRMLHRPVSEPVGIISSEFPVTCPNVSDGWNCEVRRCCTGFPLPIGPLAPARRFGLALSHARLMDATLNHFVRQAHHGERRGSTSDHSRSGLPAVPVGSLLLRDGDVRDVQEHLHARRDVGR
jgi:hypothetical protein